VARALVAVLRTTPETVLADIGRVMRLAEYRGTLDPARDTLMKLNLPWTKYFRACSTAPCELDDRLCKILVDVFPRERLLPVENRTVVTDPLKGCRNNLWEGVLAQHGLRFMPLTQVEWTVHRFHSPLLRLNALFPEGIEIPALYPGKQILHLPTVKTHGHSVTTGAIKNAFGGLLKEVRHYAHKYIHEVLVDLMTMQRELHPGVFAVMDGTVCGDGAGPRTMVPVIANLLLASADSVAIDAVAARLMGFDPLAIPYLRLCHERGLGVGDPRQIEVVGADVTGLSLGFRTRRSLVIWGDQMLRLGPLRFLERTALHSPLVVWAPFASNVYHDWLWYPTVGRARIRTFARSSWGRLFEHYRGARPAEPVVAGAPEPRPA